jgi:hypothetical protein
MSPGLPEGAAEDDAEVLVLGRHPHLHGDVGELRAHPVVEAQDLPEAYSNSGGLKRSMVTVLVRGP